MFSSLLPTVLGQMTDEAVRRTPLRPDSTGHRDWHRPAMAALTLAAVAAAFLGPL